MPYINNINSIQIYYEIHGKGEPLLLIHGLGSSTQDWENQVAFFSSRYQVIAFDLRGHGKTDKPKHPYTVSLLAEDTACFIKALNLSPVNVVGHSLGGMIAFQLAVDYPTLIKSMIIVNSAPFLSFPSLKDVLRFFLRSINVRLFGMRYLSVQLATMLFPKPEQAPLRETFIKRWCENDPKAYLCALHAFRHWNLKNKLHNLQMPTLVIAADHDYTPVSLKEDYCQKLARGKVVVIEDSHHMTILDQPARFNKAVLDFLQSSTL